MRRILSPNNWIAYMGVIRPKSLLYNERHALLFRFFWIPLSPSVEQKKYGKISATKSLLEQRRNCWSERRSDFSGSSSLLHIKVKYFIGWFPELPTTAEMGMLLLSFWSSVQMSHSYVKFSSSWIMKPVINSQRTNLWTNSRICDRTIQLGQHKFEEINREC